jgi:hypothetical protein
MMVEDFLEEVLDTGNSIVLQHHVALVDAVSVAKV